MLVMKRPQSFELLPAEDLLSEIMENHHNSPQLKQQRKIQVPVHHEPDPRAQYQRPHQPQQMPVPQPTGFYPHQTSVPIPVSVEQEPAQHNMPWPAQRVKNSVNIPVRHVPVVGPSNSRKPRAQDVHPPMYVDTEKQHALPTQEPNDAPVIREVPVTSPKIKQDPPPTSPVSQTPDVQKRPAVRKQTSLIVSDDRVTPIPMPYEHLDPENPIVEEDSEKPSSSVNEPKKKHPTVRKQTSLVVSDDHTTPIPMPYEHLDLKEEEESGVEDEVDASYETVEPVKKSVEAQDIESFGTHDEDKEEEGGGGLTPSTPGTPLSPKPQVTAVKVHEESADTDVHPQAKLSFTEGQQPLASPAPRSHVVPIKVLSSPKSPKTPKRIEEESLFGIFPHPSQAREIPISIQGSSGPANATRRVGVEPRQSQRLPQVERAEVKSPVRTGMPQPQPSNISTNGPRVEEQETMDTYTQPKPPAPKPKQQWVDPRITASLETIDKITIEATGIGQQVDALQVTSKDRNYLTIEEQLTKLLLKLDSIESFGDDNLRSRRKACIKQVQQTLDALELKLLAS